MTENLRVEILKIRATYFSLSERQERYGNCSAHIYVQEVLKVPAA